MFQVFFNSKPVFIGWYLSNTCSHGPDSSFLLLFGLISTGYCHSGVWTVGSTKNHTCASFHPWKQSQRVWILFSTFTGKLVAITTRRKNFKVLHRQWLMFFHISIICTRQQSQTVLKSPWRSFFLSACWHLFVVLILMTWNIASCGFIVCVLYCVFSPVATSLTTITTEKTSTTGEKRLEAGRRAEARWW